MKITRVKKIESDILIIGGGTAGCFAAIEASKEKNYSIVIAEKANIYRSGCLAAGVNAINAYIVDGKTPRDYVEYATKDANGIVRDDLLLTMSEGLNEVTKTMEDLGLVILKDENGKYVARGNRNIKINGERIKPILAESVQKCENVTVLNRVNITDFIKEDGRIIGAVGFSIEEEKNERTAYVIYAKKTLVATGGAAGLYRPNNPGFSRHKMWYPPFNTGAGYAMGIEAGAEMTTFEMRFIALRCKDTIAPTGTIAQGVSAKQVNAKGEVYETHYGLKTSERLYGTVSENLAGNGPCYLATKGISEEQNESLKKAYLNMAPSQTLKWIESGFDPKEENVEIEGTEPYIVGGHTASGYWIDAKRRTTCKNLFAAGDVAGGCPQKYVTGALVEGKIAGLSMLEELEKENAAPSEMTITVNELQEISDPFVKEKLEEYNEFLENKHEDFEIEQLEEAMQKVMDEYAGGIATSYQYNEERLRVANKKIKSMTNLVKGLHANDMHELMFVYELKERLCVAEVLIAHLQARKETRWHSFAENADYPTEDKAFEKYVNSVKKDGKIEILFRELVKRGDSYEHSI